MPPLSAGPVLAVDEEPDPLDPGSYDLLWSAVAVGVLLLLVGLAVLLVVFVRRSRSRDRDQR